MFWNFDVLDPLYNLFFGKLLPALEIQYSTSLFYQDIFAYPLRWAICLTKFIESMAYPNFYSLAFSDRRVLPYIICSAHSAVKNSRKRITTPDLTSDDFVVNIGDFACQVDSAVYNENGYWDISCMTSEIHEPQIVDLALTIAKYGHKFHQEFVVGDVSLTEIAYIQQMTPTICSNTTTPSPESREIVRTHYSGQDKVPTNTLIDLRDGRSYTVSKLADGNCWMTQNLRIGGDEEITLTSEDSDVEAAFVLPIAQTNGKVGWNNAAPHIYDTGSDETGGIYNWYTATAGTGTDHQDA